MIAPQLAADADEAAIRRIFGNTFVDWILATESSPGRTAEQRQVAAIVRSAAQTLDPDGVGVPGYLLLRQLTSVNPDTGITYLEQLRRAAGGRPEPLPDPPDDEVLAAMHAWASENFGGLLLGDTSPGWAGAREGLNRAIAADLTLPFTAESTYGEALFQLTSIGSASGLQLTMLGTGIVTAAFRRAAARERSPRLEDVLAELPAALNTARELWAGKTVQSLATAGLAGIFLPEGKPELPTPWGRVRVAHETDNRLFRSSQAATMQLPDGSQLISQDTGDLTVETTVPWSTKFTQPPSDRRALELRPATSSAVLQRRVEEVRLAFILAMADPQVPAMLPTWMKVDDPLSGVGSFGMSILATMRQRTPTRLTVEQAQEWERWIAILDGLPLENLGHAPQRLLRAITERQDTVDALVDAVIVWEAIFGTHDEITFRVSGSLARLLHDNLEDRIAFVKKARGIYTMRSKIVHGASDIKPAKIADSCNDAIRIAIDAFRVIATRRVDLLQVTSSARRSEQIMLE